MSAELNIRAPLRRITSPGDITKFATVVAAAFTNDALNHYLFLGKEARPDHPKLLPFENRVHYWDKVVRPRFEQGAILIESCDWAAVTLWLPPGCEKKMPDTILLSDGVREYLEFFASLKKEMLGNRAHWNFNIVGRDPGRNDKGAVRAILEPLLSYAREENTPVWLEATNAHAKGVYEYFGFEVVGETRIGKGFVNHDGWSQDAGEGVLVWGMIAGMHGWN